METQKAYITEQDLKVIFKKAKRLNVLVIGDLILDHYVLGNVERISPEAPVPVLEFQHECWMPGGAANVARNLTALGVKTCIIGVVGNDPEGKRLIDLMKTAGVNTKGIFRVNDKVTSTKTRVVAQSQQLIRIDRESRQPIKENLTRKLIRTVDRIINMIDAVIVSDYGKGTISQSLIDYLCSTCYKKAIWLSYDPKPSNPIRPNKVSLLTPNRKEAFQLANIIERGHITNPLHDQKLLQTAQILMKEFKPAILLITLGPQGMLLVQNAKPPVHIPTAALEVYDVSGAGDTVIATFTVAIACGCTPEQAAYFSNLAAGVVVGKAGTAVASPEEIRMQLSKFQSLFKNQM